MFYNLNENQIVNISGDKKTGQISEYCNHTGQLLGYRDFNIADLSEQDLAFIEDSI